MSKRKLIPLLLYILFLLVPIYWLLNMSFKSNTEILGGLTLFPQDFTLANYKVIFTDPSWYTGYLNSLYYVSLNTVISLSVALPAAYAFSRYRFLGDKHLFFWLLTNRMAPPAVFLLPFFQLYSSIGLFDVKGLTEPDPAFGIGSTLFDKVTIELNQKYFKGKRFVIETKGNGLSNIYVKDMMLNGKKLTRPFIRFADVARGGRLVMNMSTTPKDDYGAGTQK